MINRIAAVLVSLSIASTALPVPMAAAAPIAGPEGSGARAQAVPVDYRDRHWREGGAQRSDPRWSDRRDRRWDRRADRRYDDRRYDHRHYDDRRYDYRDYHRDRRHDEHRRRNRDATPYILGGIAIGAILLFNILERENKRNRGYRR